MHIYKGNQHAPYKGDGSAEPSREDLERKYAEAHRSTAVSTPKKKGNWLERHTPLVMTSLAVMVSVISLVCWMFGIDMIVPLLAAILVYLGFLVGMVLL